MTTVDNEICQQPLMKADVRKYLVINELLVASKKILTPQDYMSSFRIYAQNNLRAGRHPQMCEKHPTVHWAPEIARNFCLRTNTSYIWKKKNQATLCWLRNVDIRNSNYKKKNFNLISSLKLLSVSYDLGGSWNTRSCK